MAVGLFKAAHCCASCSSTCQALATDDYNAPCSTTPNGPTCVEGSGPDYDFGSPVLLVNAGGPSAPLGTGRDLLLAGQ